MDTMTKTQVTYATAGQCSLGGCESVADLEVTIRVGPHDWHSWRTCFAHASDEELALMDEAAGLPYSGACSTCQRAADHISGPEYHIRERDSNGLITVAMFTPDGRLLCADCWVAEEAAE